MSIHVFHTCSGVEQQSVDRTAAVVIPLAPVSMQEYIERIPLEKRSTTITEPTEIAKIARKIGDWELIAHRLGLHYPEVTAIKNDYRNYEEQKLAMYSILCYFPCAVYSIIPELQLSEPFNHLNMLAQTAQ